LVDKGETHEQAAKRELLEETGYTSTDWHYLGAVEPNPAFLNNLCHHWLAKNVRLESEPSPDEGENITVLTADFSDIQRRIRDGKINHVLALSAFSRISILWRPEIFNDGLK